MAQTSQRIIAGGFAAVFIISTLILTVGLVYQAIQSDKQSEEATMNQANQLKGKPLPGFTPLPAIAKLEVQDVAPGAGATATAKDTITVDYTGAVASTGVVFESSKDSGQPATFPLNQVIAGWTQGIPGMKEGGTRRLLIPAALAYGASPPPGSTIPPNADLVFDVTLHKVAK